jgi:hypothetical protein
VWRLATAGAGNNRKTVAAAIDDKRLGLMLSAHRKIADTASEARSRQFINIDPSVLTLSGQGRRNKPRRLRIPLKHAPRRAFRSGARPSAIQLHPSMVPDGLAIAVDQ